MHASSNPVQSLTHIERIRNLNGYHVKNIVKVAAFAATATLVASGLQAATAENTMGVSATVTRTCTVTAGALGFNTVATSGATTAQSAVAIACTAGSAADAPTVTVSGGGQPTAGGLRQMIGGDSNTALVPYTLSATSGGANLATNSTVTTTPSNGGTDYATTIHGSIAADANYQIGTFSDTVTVTVTYAQ